MLFRRIKIKMQLLHTILMFLRMLSLKSPVTLARLWFTKVLCLSSQASATHCETDFLVWWKVWLRTETELLP